MIKVSSSRDRSQKVAGRCGVVAVGGRKWCWRGCEGEARDSFLVLSFSWRRDGHPRSSTTSPNQLGSSPEQSHKNQRTLNSHRIHLQQLRRWWRASPSSGHGGGGKFSPPAAPSDGSEPRRCQRHLRFSGYKAAPLASTHCSQRTYGKHMARAIDKDRLMTSSLPRAPVATGRHKHPKVSTSQCYCNWHAGVEKSRRPQ